MDGKFSLSVEDKATIRISYIGYIEQHITTEGRTTFNITLTEDTRALDELVVIGYGTQRKGEVTSSVASVRPENFGKGAMKDVGQLIQGKLQAWQ